MSNVYKHTLTYYCLGVIYHQGLAFGEAGKNLIESKQKNLFVPGMINICLATEIFLKSINATKTFLEDETEVNGTKMYVGREETIKITPGGKGHALSELFENLPQDVKQEIAAIAANEGFDGDILTGLQRYDKVFVEWRYIYESNDPAVLGTHPLFHIFNAINSYCIKNLNRPMSNSADPLEKTDATHQ